MKPYYEHNGITIYHGDCRDVIPNLRVDCVVTDPPYGIGFTYPTWDDTLANWEKLMDETVPMMRDAAAFVVMPSCAINRLPWWYAKHRPDWLLAWYKGSPGHAAAIGFNDWEPHLAWGKPHKPMHDYWSTKCGFADTDGHPCPKPLPWALWLVQRCCPEDGIVLDPFVGSGTTLRAAKDLGRKAIGIEIEERYCEIAANRLAQEVLF